MHIILANPRGFCAGVKMAIQTLEAALDRFGTPLYVYHEIVHNTWVVEHFRQRGVCFVDEMDDVPFGSRLLFSAHGVSPELRLRALERNIHTIDATCPLVDKVHKDVIRYASAGYQIILIGHRGHDEVIGTMSEAPGYIRIIENEDEIKSLPLPANTKVAYLTQTTLSVTETEGIVAQLRRRFPDIVGPARSNICYATQNRQDAIAQLCQGVDLALIVGSRTSSNSRRLAERAEALGICSYLVDGPDDIATGWFQGDETVLVSAGASAPEAIVQQCIEVLRTRFDATFEEKTTCEEKLAFKPPRI